MNCERSEQSLKQKLFCLVVDFEKQNSKFNMKGKGQCISECIIFQNYKKIVLRISAQKIKKSGQTKEIGGT